MIAKSVDATISASEHPNISKRISVSGLTLSVAVLSAGSLVLFSTNGIVDKSSALNLTLMLLGFGLILFGLFLLFRKSKEHVYVPTGSVTKAQSFFFDLKFQEMLIDCINMRQFPSNAEMKSDVNGNIRMDIILSKDEKFAAIQLFRFVPYAYSPITSVHYFTEGEAAAVSSFLALSKQSQ